MGCYAIRAFAVDDDLVTFHVVAFRQQIGYSAKASHHVEDLLTLLAKKKMMVPFGGAFVMGCGARNFDVAHLAFLNQLLECPIDRGDPQTGHLFTGLGTDGLCSERQR